MGAGDPSSQTRLVFPWPVPWLGDRHWWTLGGGNGGWVVVATPAPSGSSWRWKGFAEGTRVWQAWRMVDWPLGQRQRRPSLHPDPNPSEGKRLAQDGLLTKPGPFLLSLLSSDQSLPLRPCPFVSSGSETSQPVCRPNRDLSPRAGFLCA